MSAINSSDRIAANFVFLRDMVCLHNILINTLHKGDSIITYNDEDDDDDDDNNNNNNNNNQYYPSILI
jgi:hypothetical protein